MEGRKSRKGGRAGRRGAPGTYGFALRDYNLHMVKASILADLRSRLERELARPAGAFVPLRVDAEIVGWLDERRAAQIVALGGVFEQTADGVRFVSALPSPAARSDAVDRVAHLLAAARELTAWRNERYAVAMQRSSPPYFLLERAAARYFGVHTYAVHVNGLVEIAGRKLMWIARRSPTKAIDPGMLDNLVGGGMAAGADPTSTLIKEAWEEAGIPARVARRATPAATLRICRLQPDGVQRETIYAYDLVLPLDFVPAGQDGEVVEQRLMPLEQVVQLVANRSGEDVVTADASLVITDCLLRHGVIPNDAPEFAALDALRNPDLRLET